MIFTNWTIIENLLIFIWFNMKIALQKYMKIQNTCNKYKKCVIFAKK